MMNCSVRMNEVLRYDKTSSQKKKKHSSKRRQNATSDSSQAADTTSDDVYHPVVCSICNTEVGVYDSDEVYHLFNVLASYA